MVAGFIVLLLKQAGIGIIPGDFEATLSTIVMAAGFIWQLVNRYRKGGVTALGRKI